MKIDGLVLVEGSEVANLVVASGSVFPNTPDQGELFYLNIAQEFYSEGLYFYNGLNWTQVSTTDALNAAVTAASMPSGDNFPTTAANGELFYKSSSDISGSMGLYVYQLANATWYRISLNTELSSHANDYTLHLTSAQNTWLDAITATSAEVNYLSGVTSSIQTQINNKQSELVSGTNIKTINGSSLLGAGDLTIGSTGGSTGGSWYAYFPGTTANVFGTVRKYPPANIQIIKLTIWCSSAAPTDTTVTLKKNGASVGSATIIAGSTNANVVWSANDAGRALTSSDYLTVDLTSQGAVDVGVRIDYQ